MECLDCGHAMATRRENVRYDASGLPGVTLVGVEVSRCAGCGAHEVAIPHIGELHRVMACAVLRKPARLTPAEIRFLRKSLGWSGRELGAYMGAAGETVSRWENGRTPIGTQADRLLRLLVLHVCPVAPFDLVHLKDIGRETPAELRARLVAGTTGWTTEAA